MTLTLTLPMGEFLYTGKQVTFKTPCESEGLTGLIVEGSTYDIVNALGTALVANSFDAGAMVSVIFDKETKKAYVQNADTNAYLEGRFNGIDTSGKVSKAGDTMRGKLIAENNSDYATKQVRNVFIIADGASLPSGANGDICLIHEV